MKRMIELYDLEPNFTVLIETSKELRLKFFVTSDEPYQFNAYKDEVGLLSGIRAETQLPIKNDAWIVEFERKAGGQDYNSRYGITDTGNTALVFAHSKNCLDYFINKYKPEQFLFSAKEDSRKKLYTTFLNRMAREYNYDIDHDSDGFGEYYYVFDRL